MSRLPRQTALLPSVLDRLLDACAQEHPGRPSWSESELIGQLCRDLEDLLNTTATTSRELRDLPGLADSLLGYGLPELPIHDGATRSDRLALAHQVEEAIRRFEPRLAGVRVSLPTRSQEKWNRLPLAIEGWLRESSGTRVSLSAALDPLTHRIEVRPAGS